jgi:hypothetical protein
MNKIRAVVHRSPEVNVCVVENEEIISSFEIYHPKNTNHNQDGNHNDNKVWLTHFLLSDKN